ncbi:MAG: hypothetical protein OK449_00230 [Thaumarchaeota archaeon]|nr:hypothetical protein [Nitrososphaerota archaeon]
MSKGTTAALIITLVVLSMAIGGALGTIAAGNQAVVSTVTQTASSASTNSSAPFILTMVITNNNIYNSSIGSQPAFFVSGPNGLESSANITLPAHRIIEIIIMNFDQGNATFIGPQYENVTGTVNDTMTFYNNDAMNATQGPSGIVLQGAQTVSNLAPPREQYLSHTFTVPSIGLNIPIAAESTEVAYFTTGGPGSYTWLCESLCGSGANGLGGAMSAPGWMTGVLTVS